MDCFVFFLGLTDFSVQVEFDDVLDAEITVRYNGINRKLIKTQNPVYENVIDLQTFHVKPSDCIEISLYHPGSDGLARSKIKFTYDRTSRVENIPATTTYKLSIANGQKVQFCEGLSFI